MFFDNLFDDFNPFGAYTYRKPRRQTNSRFEDEDYDDNKEIIARRILEDEYNYICFDCHRELSDLDYFDLKNGIFLCGNCAQQHAKLSKEIAHPMTGNIRTLEEKDLLLLYYGGNKNLLDFIRSFFPLLENMQKKDMFATKAMDYYRKLIRAKAYDEQKPDMPGKKKAYTSIFQKKVSPARKQRKTNVRDRRMKYPIDRVDIDENRDNLFSTTFFGDDLFNRNRQNQRRKAYDPEEENYFTTEPADIKKKENENEENDDAGMKKEKRSDSHNNHVNDETKYKKIENKTKKEKRTKSDDETKEREEKAITNNTITINQIGEISNYPEAMEIDGMECE